MGSIGKKKMVSECVSRKSRESNCKSATHYIKCFFIKCLKHPLPRSIIRIRYEKINVKFSASSRTIVSYPRVLNIRKSRGKIIIIIIIIIIK